VESGMDRQDAYKLVQRNAHAALAAGEKFQDRVRALPEFTERLTSGQITALFDPWEQLQQVDAIFDRLGLAERVPA
ncbi:MAG TPA: hypothetical protein VFQ54_06060, partial [Thermomicrobiales bacterium]|nr:hypothetical protein [Thermomicrobiales bacterium]